MSTQKKYSQRAHQKALRALLDKLGIDRPLGSFKRLNIQGVGDPAIAPTRDLTPGEIDDWNRLVQWAATTPRGQQEAREIAAIYAQWEQPQSPKPNLDHKRFGRKRPQVNGELLTALRQSLRLSQAALASIAGIETSLTISRGERGLRWEFQTFEEVTEALNRASKGQLKLLPEDLMQHEGRV